MVGGFSESPYVNIKIGEFVENLKLIPIKPDYALVFPNSLWLNKLIILQLVVRGPRCCCQRFGGRRSWGRGCENSQVSQALRHPCEQSVRGRTTYGN